LLLKSINYSESKVLDLHDINLNCQDVLVLARCLEYGSNVEDLNISNNTIAKIDRNAASKTEQRYSLCGLSKLSKSLETLALKVLNLSGNDMGPDGGVILAKSLSKCVLLEHLNLASCYILSKVKTG
jgi:hypothetical protein